MMCVGTVPPVTRDAGPADASIDASFEDPADAATSDAPQLDATTSDAATADALSADS